MNLEPERTAWRNRIHWFCTFTIAFSGYLFLTRPDPNGAQLVFRVGLLALGVGGPLVSWLTRPRE